MEEPLTFWLDNRNCVGTRVASAGDQILVLYRDRYYVVVGGSAQTRAGKPIRFSISSMPSLWKRVLKGELPPPETGPDYSDLPLISQRPKRKLKITEKPAMEPVKETVSEPVAAVASVKIRKKVDKKPGAPAPIAANCPYCNAAHEIPLDKGKLGKPFFMPCNRCKVEFAVRLVPVTVYQAQVAGFR